MQPNCLNNKINKSFYLLIYLLLFGIIVSFLSGLGVWAFCLFFMSFSLASFIINYSILIGIIFTFVRYLFGTDIFGSNYFNKQENYKIKPVESLIFSFNKVRRMLKIELKSLIYGIFLVSTIVSIQMYIMKYDLLEILFGVAVIISALIPAGLIEGTVEAEEIERKTIPNQGIRKSIINLVFLTIIVYPYTIIVVILGQYVLLSQYVSLFSQYVVLKNIYLIPALTSSLLFSILFAMAASGTPVIKHFSLRIILWVNGFIPWNYARFLDYATERILLQKVGGGYIFVHRMLMEHFAKMELKN